MIILIYSICVYPTVHLERILTAHYQRYTIQQNNNAPQIDKSIQILTAQVEIFKAEIQPVPSLLY